MVVGKISKMKTQRLFFDDLVDHYHRESEQSKADIDKEVAKNFGKILDAAKIFSINGAVVDDLYHIPHDNTNYEQTFHLPFPAIFFELMNPLEISITQERRVKGILYGKMEDADMFQHKGAPLDQFVMNLFYKDATKRGVIQDSVYFRTSHLPNLAFLTSEGFFYEYTPETGVIATLKEGDEQIYQRVKPHDNNGMRTNFQRLLNLSVNLIDYINAHNVVVRKADRGGPIIDVINRKRVKKGKKTLPTKPYYWIDIKQSVANEENISQSDQLEYREWVRGHFQRYNTRDGIVKNWIEPYIRGPTDAPWKENRYRVLDDMLKKGPKLED